MNIDANFVQADGSISHHDMHDYLHLTQKGYDKAFEPVNDLLVQLLTESETDLVRTEAEGAADWKIIQVSRSKTSDETLFLRYYNEPFFSRFQRLFYAPVVYIIFASKTHTCTCFTDFFGIYYIGLYMLTKSLK